MGNLNVVILAGGESSRFWPLKEKNSYTFLGSTNIELQIERFKKIQPSKIYLVKNNDLKIINKDLTIIEQEGNGMAGAIATTLKEINPEEELLILNANDYYDENLVADFSKIRGGLLKENQAMIVGYKTQSYFPGGYLKLDNEFITDVVEKPGEGNTPSDFINIVFHYFPQAKKLREFLHTSKSDKDDVYEVALSNMIKSGMKFKMLEYTKEWKTIKYPWHVLDVMNYFLDSIKEQKISSQAAISPKAHINGNVIIEEGVRVFEGAIIHGPVYLGKNTIVGNNSLVRNSMIGENCVIGFSTEVARSYFKSNIWLHKNYVGDSVFEDNISLGSNAVTGNLRLDEQNIIKNVRGNEVNTQRNKLGAVVGSDVRIGVGTVTMPGVRIGQGSFVGPNVSLDKDVGDKMFVKMESKLVITENKFDITQTSRDNIKKDLIKNG